MVNKTTLDNKKSTLKLSQKTNLIKRYEPSLNAAFSKLGAPTGLSKKFLIHDDFKQERAEFLQLTKNVAKSKLDVDSIANLMAEKLKKNKPKLFSY